MASHEETARHLRTELAALEARLDSQNRLITALREQLQAHEEHRTDERRTQIFRRAAIDIVPEKGAREFAESAPLESDDMSEALIAISSRLDHKFAEIKALSEITEHVTSGMFFDEVLDHVYENFQNLIPYDRIGVALIEQGTGGKQLVRAQWHRANYEPLYLKLGYAAELEHSSLRHVAVSRHPRIINDKEGYVAENPRSHSARMIVKEGIRASLTCPLVARDEVIGFIFFSSREKDTYRDQHIELFMQIAGELAVTLEKSRSYEDLYIRNEFMKKVFGQYVTNEVAEAVLNADAPISLGGERRHVTVLMADLRGFTPMSEQLSSEEVVDALNVYLGRMTDIVMQYGGSIDNIIGDAVMAVFGTPATRPDDAVRAVACAVAMQNAMAEVNEEVAARDLPPLRIGIGISTGDAVAGNIGSELRMKYSVIGSIVNLAARIEGIADGGQVFVSKATFDEAGGALRTSGHLNVKLKGVERPVAIYEVDGVDGEHEISRQAAE